MTKPFNHTRFNWRELGYKYASPEYYRLWRQVNNEHSREYHRKYDSLQYKKHPKREYARRQRYIDKNPEKVKAHKLVRQAVISGKLIKKPCNECQRLRVVAHHDDYDKPLSVIWLCEVHHKERHQLLKNLDNL